MKFALKMGSFFFLQGNGRLPWSRAKSNRVLPRECTGPSKCPLPTKQKKTLHIDITRWSTLKSDWLYSLQPKMEMLYAAAAAAAAVSLQSCLTLCDLIDSSPPGSPVPRILQARTLEWVAISFSNAGKWKVKVKLLSHVWLLAMPWTAAHKAPPSMGFTGKSTRVGCHCLLQEKLYTVSKNKTGSWQWFRLWTP